MAMQKKELTPEQLEILKNNYGLETMKEISILTGVCANTLLAKVKEFKIIKQERNKKQVKKEYQIANYNYNLSTENGNFDINKYAKICM